MMKNTGTKILILGIVIAVAVAGILAFYPTIVAPPTDVPVENLHEASLARDISGFSESASMAFNDSIYNVVVDKLNLYRAEKFLTETELDNQTKSLVQKYLPVFTAHSYKRFQASVWRDADHKAMLSRIAHLRTLKVDNGETDAVAGSYSSALANIEHIISQYKKAKDVTRYSSFYSVSDANKKIREAESYKTADYLKNCTDLVNKLSEVKVKIGNSHYNKVAAEVEEMRRYKVLSEESFDALVQTVNNAITEYNNNCSNYGPSAKSADNLKSRANEYYKEARTYYEYERVKPEIRISPIQWTSITSPHSSYRAYQSSNYHLASSESTMSFTIKGYESFTFHIRSNGEADHDYVMVDMDRIPTTESNYASTKGSPNSGSAFYSYKTVNLNGLSKEKSYTIYVVYRKDGTKNEGTDRGYVLIPYAEKTL